MRIWKNAKLSLSIIKNCFKGLKYALSGCIKIHHCVLQDIGPLRPLPCSHCTSSAITPSRSSVTAEAHWPCVILGWHFPFCMTYFGVSSDDRECEWSPCIQLKACTHTWVVFVRWIRNDVQLVSWQIAVIWDRDRYIRNRGKTDKNRDIRIKGKRDKNRDIRNKGKRNKDRDVQINWKSRTDPWNTSWTL